MELTYHIHHHAEGERGSQLDSLTPTNRAGGFASGPFVRKLWTEMVASFHAHGHMTHPDTGRKLDVAMLMFGGTVDRMGKGQGGQVCQKWKAGGQVEVLVEPEPHLYGPEALRARMRAEALAAHADVPEQPEPPTLADIPAPEPMQDVTTLSIPMTDDEEEVSLIEETHEAIEGDPSGSSRPTRKRSSGRRVQKGDEVSL